MKFFMWQKKNKIEIQIQKNNNDRERTFFENVQNAAIDDNVFDNIIDLGKLKAL